MVKSSEQWFPCENKDRDHLRRLRLSTISKNGPDIVVKGISAEKVSVAKKNILDCLPCTLTMVLGESNFGSMIGRGGQIVRGLICKKHFVQIDLKDGKVSY